MNWNAENGVSGGSAELIWKNVTVPEGWTYRIDGATLYVWPKEG